VIQILDRGTPPLQPSPEHCHPALIGRVQRSGGDHRVDVAIERGPPIVKKRLIEGIVPTPGRRDLVPQTWQAHLLRSPQGRIEAPPEEIRNIKCTTPAEGDLPIDHRHVLGPEEQIVETGIAVREGQRRMGELIEQADDVRAQPLGDGPHPWRKVATEHSQEGFSGLLIRGLGKLVHRSVAEGDPIEPI